MEEAEARTADCGAGSSQETHTSVSNYVLSHYNFSPGFLQCEEDGGDVSLASRCGRVSPHQEVGAPPGVDCQVHGGVLQAGGQGEGAGAGHLTAL